MTVLKSQQLLNQHEIHSENWNSNKYSQGEWDYCELLNTYDINKKGVRVYIVKVRRNSLHDIFGFDYDLFGIIRLLYKMREIWKTSIKCNRRVE